MADKCQIPAGSVSENGMVVSQYTVVLRSRSGCRVRFGGYIDLRLPDGCGGEAQVRISTRWQDLGLEFPVPRELWMAVTVNAADIDAAVRSAAAVGLYACRDHQLLRQRGGGTACAACGVQLD